MAKVRSLQNQNIRKVFSGWDFVKYWKSTDTGRSHSAMARPWSVQKKGRGGGVQWSVQIEKILGEIVRVRRSMWGVFASPHLIISTNHLFIKTPSCHHHYPDIKVFLVWGRRQDQSIPGWKIYQHVIADHQGQTTQRLHQRYQNLNQCWPWEDLQGWQTFCWTYSATNLSLKWSEPSQDSRASKSPACRSVAPQAPPWWPRPRPGQLPTGGSHRPSLMPRFKCKFPGHRAPTAGADDYIRIAKRRRRRQHWWCLSLSPGFEANMPLNQPLPTFTFQQKSGEGHLTNKRHSGKNRSIWSSPIMWTIALFADQSVGESPGGSIAVDNQRWDQKLTPGDRLDLFSANRSKIDRK